MKLTGICIIIFSFVSSIAFATEKPAYQSNYAGQENRRIKSLSTDDIDQLSHGRGWGLAKAAELNGMPGPVHVLEMKDKIALTAEQEKEIKAIFTSMKQRATILGKQFIRLEEELNNAFAKRDINKESLEQKLTEIAMVTKKLRFVHLMAHLKTPEILSQQQITLYNQLRGYGNGDPCSNMPAGHDEAMWKKHNGCK